LRPLEGETRTTKPKARSQDREDRENRGDGLSPRQSSAYSELP
jgi:hypothetical protein